MRWLDGEAAERAALARDSPGTDIATKRRHGRAAGRCALDAHAAAMVLLKRAR